MQIELRITVKDVLMEAFYSKHKKREIYIPLLEAVKQTV